MNAHFPKLFPDDPQDRDLEDEKGVRGFYALLFLFVAIISLLFSFRYYSKSSDNRLLDRRGVSAQGVIARKAVSGSGKEQTRLLIYKYENRSGWKECSNNDGAKACYFAIERVTVPEDIWRDASIGQSVDVTYLPSDTKTVSRIENYPILRLRNKVLFFISVVSAAGFVILSIIMFGAYLNHGTVHMSDLESKKSL